jgi:hypothetical protein
LLAWRSIESDIRDMRLNLDNIQSKQATQYREQTSSGTQRLVRETFKWLVVPSQGVKKDGSLGEIEWEPFALNPVTIGLGKEIDRVLAENELVINEWAPIHLHNVLKTWFWKDGVVDVAALEVWQKSCSYLYLPRLAKSTVMQHTIAVGARSRDFFGIAQGKSEGRYLGFVFDQITTPIMDVVLLIEPVHAAAYEEATRPAPVTVELSVPATTSPVSPSLSPTFSGSSKSVTASSSVPVALPTHFYASAEIDPRSPALQFAKIVNELVELFSAKHGTEVRIRVDIEANDARGFDESTVRAAKENSKVLGMRNAEFEG